MKIQNGKQKAAVVVMTVMLALGVAVPVSNTSVRTAAQGSEAQSTTQAIDATTQAADVTTQAADATTQAADATTQTADTAAAVTMGTGFGVALMAGEDMTVSFAETTRVYIPITVAQKGYLDIIRQDESTQEITVGVYQTDRTSEVLKPEAVEGSADTGAFAIEAGDYYLYVEGDAGTDCVLTGNWTAGLTMSIGKKSSLVLGNHKASECFYMQFTPSRTGYLEFENATSAKVTVSLKNSSKKALSGSRKLSAYSSKNHKDGKTLTGYGVKKGQTYLLCIKAAASVRKVSFKSSLKKYSTVGGSSFSGAQSLSRNKKVYATCAGGAKASYFRFKKTSYSRRNVTVKTLRNQGKLKVSLYYKEVKGKKKGKILPVKVNGKQIGWTQSSEYQKTLKIPYNWPNVTYYLKISNANSKSNGSYQVVVK